MARNSGRLRGNRAPVRRDMDVPSMQAGCGPHRVTRGHSQLVTSCHTSSIYCPRAKNTVVFGAWSAASALKRLSRSSVRHGTNTNWLQLVAQVAGAVWYATGYLYSPYTAAEHSIRSLEQGALAPRSHAIAAGLEATERPYVGIWTCHRCKPAAGCIE